MSLPDEPAGKRRKLQDSSEPDSNEPQPTLIYELTHGRAPNAQGTDTTDAAEEMIQVEWLDSKSDPKPLSQELPAFRFYSPQPAGIKQRLEQLLSHGKALIRYNPLHLLPPFAFNLLYSVVKHSIP